MSIGQRITQKRKGLGMSQEALGEQMGVSRQAIYKWESDSALPEIEKLVALAKLFGVSVGWLLGVEECEETPRVESDSMDQRQLDMVEEIVRRYIAAQPKPKPQHRWLRVLVACVLVIVMLQLFSRIDQLNSQYNHLQNSVSNISYSVNSQVNSIAGRVEQILMAQNNLTAEWSAEIVNTDYYNGVVTLSMKAVPKTYLQGMGAVFVIDCGDGPQEFESILTDGRTFACQATVPLTDKITASVVFVTADGTRQTQVLEAYTGLLYDSYVELSIQEDLMFANVHSGELTKKSWYVHVSEIGKTSTASQIVEYRVGIFRNQELIAWGEPCEKPGNYTGDFSGWQFFKMPDLVLTDLRYGETIEIAALVTDSYGRQYMVCEIPYLVSVSEDGNGELTWPDVAEYDRDPQNWIFE